MRSAHGVYVAPDARTDAMYLFQLRCGQAVFFHEAVFAANPSGNG